MASAHGFVGDGVLKEGRSHGWREIFRVAELRLAHSSRLIIIGVVVCQQADRSRAMGTAQVGTAQVGTPCG